MKFPFLPALLCSASFFLVPSLIHAGPPAGRGPMPEEYRDTIHSLFASHDSFTREWKATKTGYTARTVTKDKAMAKLLQSHVKQMQTRLSAGGMVRMWDPAFRELMEYYDQMEFTINEIEDGIEVEVKGKTPEAIKVAQNHAKIVTGFVEKGEKVMHEEHDPALPGNEKGSGGKSGGGRGKGNRPAS